MNKKPKYDCHICSEKHDIYFGIKGNLSQEFQNILDDTPERVIEMEGLYMLDKMLVIIPVELSITTAYEQEFYYQSWVECDFSSFQKFSATYQNEIGGETEGRLHDELIPYFKNSKGLKCKVHFTPNMQNDDMPYVTILDESEIKDFQEKGLTKEEVHLLMNRMYHKNA